MMLGAFGNLKTCLNEGWVVCKTEHVERGVLHPGQFRSFWVTWEDGLVQVRDWSLIREGGGGGLQNGKIAGPKVFTPRPPL